MIDSNTTGYVVVGLSACGASMSAIAAYMSYRDRKRELMRIKQEPYTLQRERINPATLSEYRNKLQQLHFSGSETAPFDMAEHLYAELIHYQELLNGALKIQGQLANELHQLSKEKNINGADQGANSGS